MSETHEKCLSCFDVLDELRDIIRCLDFLEHANDSFICAAVERTVKSCCGGSDGGIWVDEGGADVGHCCRGTVHLMIGVENEKDVQRFC